MDISIPVTKASGEVVPFSLQKLKNSLMNAGTSQELTDEIIQQIIPHLYPGIPTKKIYRHAFGLLKKHAKITASKYHLKKAIMEMGPSGFPFERLVAAVFSKLGYQTIVGQLEQGTCVTHEIDVIADNEQQHFLIECKFHNLAGKMSDVKVPLYIHSRFNDVADQWRKQEELANKQLKGWVVTNTRFSPDAEQYARCSGLSFMSWDYPKEHALKELIDRFHLYPITCLNGLTKAEKQQLLDKNCVLVNELSDREFNFLKMNPNRTKTLQNEINELLDEFKAR